MLRLRTGVVVSVGLHAVAALALVRVVVQRAAPPHEPYARAFAWLVSPPPASRASAAAQSPIEQPSLREPEERPAREPASPPASPEEGSPATDRAGQGETNPAQSEPASRPRRATDLIEASRRAAVEVLEEREHAKSYRSFVFPGTIGEQEAFEEAARLRRVERGLQQPLTAFDSPSKGRAGIAETTAMGQTIRWVSDDCYQVTGAPHLFILPPLAGLFAIPTTVCLATKARGDLFAAAKPAYLMDEEERAASDAAFQRREVLRRPATGVAMPLDDRGR